MGALTDGVIAVIVVPNDQRSSPFLAPGRCGAPPALVESSHVCGHAGHQRWRLGGDTPDCYMCSHPLLGLPLWWDGELVPEGWDRFIRTTSPVWSHIGGVRSLWGSPSLLAVIEQTMAVDPSLIGRVVLLDHSLSEDAPCR